MYETQIDQILESVRKARGQGYRITQSDWGTASSSGYYECYSDHICPLGAFMLGKVKIDSTYPDAANYLGVDIDWVHGFTYGFDGITHPRYAMPKDYEDGWQVGKQIRERILNVPD